MPTSSEWLIDCPNPRPDLLANIYRPAGAIGRSISGLRALLLLIAAIGVHGCSGGYVIEQNVTVPPEVQRAFKAAGPGLVMNRANILGVLCNPSNEPVTFHYERGTPYSSCEAKREFEDEVSGTAFAFRPDGTELDRLDVHTREVLTCGQTGPVDDSGARKDAFSYFYYHSVEPERQVAIGSSKGECVSSSCYVVNITLALK